MNTVKLSVFVYLPIDTTIYSCYTISIIISILIQERKQIMFAMHSVNVNGKRVSVREQGGLLSLLSFCE